MPPPGRHLRSGFAGILAASAPIREDAGKVQISKASAEVLQLKEGEEVRYVELKPTKAQ